jgi:hypothetical protein
MKTTTRAVVLALTVLGCVAPACLLQGCSGAGDTKGTSQPGAAPGTYAFWPTSLGGMFGFGRAGSQVENLGREDGPGMDHQVGR